MPHRTAGHGNSARQCSVSSLPIGGFAHACKLGLEGIVSKRRDSRYRSGRSPDWINPGLAPGMNASPQNTNR
jgi:hypothetical protein